LFILLLIQCLTNITNMFSNWFIDIDKRLKIKFMCFFALVWEIWAQSDDDGVGYLHSGGVGVVGVCGVANILIYHKMHWNYFYSLFCWLIHVSTLCDPWDVNFMKTLQWSRLIASFNAHVVFPFYNILERRTTPG
jgi:hypothetical protein